MSAITTLIIRFIITFVIYFSIFLAAYLPIMYIENRKLDKHISNKMSTTRKSGAAHDKTKDEIHAQLDRIDKSFDRIGKSMDRISESLDRIDKSMGNIIKSAEALENFHESEFWNEKNIH